MADAGHIATDKLLKKLEKDVAREYKIAVEDMESKLTAYLEKTEEQRKVQESLLKAGKITQQDYSDWCFRHTMMGKRWEQMRDTLAADMHHTNEIALGITKGRMPDVYALNANFATFQLEKNGQIDVGLTYYNHDTSEYLLGDQRQLMPKPSTRKAKQIAANKDMQWNKQKIQSAVLQGVLQGESPYDVAGRLRQVGQMNYNASVRYARTMTTSAQNAGRYEAYRRATRLGVDLTIEWQATLDSRTRHDHRLMHGQRTEVDKPFRTPDGFTIYYPADCTGESTAPQKEIWNCRCTLLSWVKGFEGDTVKNSPKMGNMSFNEWRGVQEADLQQLQDRLELYVSGGYNLNTLLSDSEKIFIAEDSIPFDKPMYRVEDAGHTADLLDMDEIDMDDFQFNGNYRSFSRDKKVLNGMLDEISEDWAGIENPVVFEVQSGAKQFSMEKYATNYMTDQKESLVGGRFSVIGERYETIGGQGVRVIELKQKSAPQISDFTAKRNPVIIKQEDILVPRAIGAKRASFDILDLETGKRYDLVDGTYITNVEVFAGKGTRKVYRNADVYANKYGGKAEDWQHAKGIGMLDTEEGEQKAELHWSQCEGIGRKDFFIKKWLY